MDEQTLEVMRRVAGLLRRRISMEGTSQDYADLDRIDEILDDNTPAFAVPRDLSDGTSPRDMERWAADGGR